MITLEVCANSLRSALAAQAGGAVRVELCDNLGEGGTTPSAGTIIQARKLLDIQLFVLIRPRSGDFLYDDIEYQIIERDIRLCSETGCDGVVFGILDRQGNIDFERNAKLVEIANSYGMKTTFHRAIDRCNDIIGSLDTIIEAGFDRILTSGGFETALLGADVIRRMIEKSEDRISIQPGGGITENNIQELVSKTGLREFHGSFRSRYLSKMEYWSDTINDLQSEKEIWETDEAKVKNVITLANQIKT